LIYFAALIAFALYLGNTFAGGYIYMRGEGLVIGEPAVVAAEFIATVSAVPVKDGQEVKRGEIVSHISSQYMSETRAKLASDYAARASRLAEVKARREIVDAVLVSAEARERVAANGLAQLATIQKKGYLPILTHTAATDQAFKGKQEAEALRAEGRALDGQIATMSSASEQADCALKELVALYDDGKLRSMMDGVVGKVLVSPGSVVRPGEPMIEIVGKHRFVVGVVSGLAPLSPPSRRRRHHQQRRGEPARQDRQGQRHCRRAAERIPEGIRAHRRNTMARNEPTRAYGRILAGDGGLGASNHWIAAGGV